MSEEKEFIKVKGAVLLATLPMLQNLTARKALKKLKPKEVHSLTMILRRSMQAADDLEGQRRELIKVYSDESFRQVSKDKIEDFRAAWDETLEEVIEINRHPFSESALIALVSEDEGPTIQEIANLDWMLKDDFTEDG